MLNRTDKITFSSSSNKYIDYTYDANGSLIRKRQYDNVGGVATLQNTTDYIDGFVYIAAGSGTSALSYFPMPEGRVVNNSGTLAQEFIITDQQGNARVSFQNNGSGSAVVKQETSYYGFGMQLANSPVTPPSIPNKQLYNEGSEWQNDYTGNLPDYQQTFYRNYDAALGRFIGVDPVAESAESTTGYQYAGDNPIMMNDPLGDLNKNLPSSNSGEPASPIQTLRNGVLDQFNADMEAFFGGSVAGGGYDLYDTNPAAYWDAYNSGEITGGGVSIYHAGDGTANDPSTGSLSAVNAILNGNYSLNGSMLTYSYKQYYSASFGSEPAAPNPNDYDVRTKTINIGGANQEGYFNYLDPSSIRLAYGTKGPDLTPMYFANFRLPAEFNNRLPFAMMIGGKIEKSVNVNLAQISIGINIKQIQKILNQIGIDGVENTIAYSFDAAGKAVNAALISGAIQSLDNRTATDLFLNTFQSSMRNNFRASDIGVYPGFTVPGVPFSILRFISAPNNW